MDVPGAAQPATPPTPAPPTPSLPPTPSASHTGASSPSTTTYGSSAGDTTVTPIVAKLFNTTAQNVTVSFQVQNHVVVTVFTDKATGKEIIQFPSEELIAFGELLDKDAGKVLDKSA